MTVLIIGLITAILPILAELFTKIDLSKISTKPPEATDLKGLTDALYSKNPDENKKAVDIATAWAKHDANLNKLLLGPKT